ncbi:cytochrome b/b6 domain-containing protein [Microvirga puerhi]|uniref:Cytochrome b/b6 domain-containing protein n=1 Tax=Microvirga puerhi TaxID=2876078 RepID=A0ABS7VRQ2_9HYPH|nr:cytochrome b/b6 domain-containing protein [Microvirga puerhi]MBZ6078215.1 cytochrome b/b6 domain-containing protein [Microvirga puerhi]
MIGRHTLIRRHSLMVRVTHWINAVCLLILLMSGLQIFNAHPALYWGQASAFDHPILALTATDGGEAGNRGVTEIFGHTFDTTGILGASLGSGAELQRRGFPSWLTLPSYQDLATGRRWHFFFAWLLVLNGTVYFLYGVVSGHLRRDLLPTGRQLRAIGHTIREHLLLRFPRGDEARRYNVLQKLAYLAVALVLLPLAVLTGLTMSPGMDAAVPELLSFFGGRQSARTIHFLAASGLVLFVAVHVAMVLLSGAWNNLRSMITGSYLLQDSVHADRS